VFFLGGQCEYEENSSSIFINEYADAIYSPTENNLYFRKLRDISAIFDGIDILYREATEEEVKNFLDYNFIELSEGFASDNVKTNNRKRIAMALETLRKFSDDEKRTVFEYIKDYCPELANENSKFNVHNENSLKRLLYGIEQRYYTTPVGEERRLANSVISLNQGGPPNE
jgi:hemerythrin-like domain-containing protein